MSGILKEKLNRRIREGKRRATKILKQCEHNYVM